MGTAGHHDTWRTHDKSPRHVQQPRCHAVLIHPQLDSSFVWLAARDRWQAGRQVPPCLSSAHRYCTCDDTDALSMRSGMIRLSSRVALRQC